MWNSLAVILVMVHSVLSRETLETFPNPLLRNQKLNSGHIGIHMTVPNQMPVSFTRNPAYTPRPEYLGSPTLNRMHINLKLHPTGVAQWQSNLANMPQTLQNVANIPQWQSNSAAMLQILQNIQSNFAGTPYRRPNALSGNGPEITSFGQVPQNFINPNTPIDAQFLQGNIQNMIKQYIFSNQPQNQQQILDDQQNELSTNLPYVNSEPPSHVNDLNVNLDQGKIQPLTTTDPAKRPQSQQGSQSNQEDTISNNNQNKPFNLTTETIPIMVTTTSEIQNGNSSDVDYGDYKLDDRRGED